MIGGWWHEELKGGVTPTTTKVTGNPEVKTNNQWDCCDKLLLSRFSSLFHNLIHLLSITKAFFCFFFNRDTLPCPKRSTRGWHFVTISVKNVWNKLQCECHCFLEEKTYRIRTGLLSKVLLGCLLVSALEWRSGGGGGGHEFESHMRSSNLWIIFIRTLGKHWVYNSLGSRRSGCSGLWWERALLWRWIMGRY